MQNGDKKDVGWNFLSVTVRIFFYTYLHVQILPVNTCDDKKNRMTTTRKARKRKKMTTKSLLGLNPRLKRTMIVMHQAGARLLTTMTTTMTMKTSKSLLDPKAERYFLIWHLQPLPRGGCVMDLTPAMVFFTPHLVVG